MTDERLEDTTSRRVTIVDVAARAGVSVSAASKVLRNAYGVSPRMRDRVEDAMSELQYRPLAAARGMRGRAFTLGVLVSDIQNPFYSQVLDGITGGVAESPYEVLVGIGGVSAHSQERTIESMIDRQMDGLILVSPLAPTSALTRLAERHPLVVVGRHGPGEGYDTVSGDDLAGSALVVDHLIGLGHERIGFIKNTPADASDPSLPHEVRLRGYVEQMAKRGLEDAIDILPSMWSQAGGTAVARELLARRDAPTALHAGADVAAFAVLGEYRAAARSIPGDLSLVGYDNSPIAEMSAIDLTAVDQSAAQLGAAAARLLLERVEGRREAEHLLTAPTLVVRRTTGPLGR